MDRIHISYWFCILYSILGVPIKLIGGEGEMQGNVYVDGKPVCDDGWNENAGKAACRQLGFTGVEQITSGEYGKLFQKKNLVSLEKHANIEFNVNL